MAYWDDASSGKGGDLLRQFMSQSGSGFHGKSFDELGSWYKDGYWLTPVYDGQVFDQSSGLMSAGPIKSYRLTQDLGKGKPTNVFGGGGSGQYDGTPYLELDPTGKLVGQENWSNMGTDKFTDIGALITALASMAVVGGAVAGGTAMSAGGAEAAAGAGAGGSGAGAGSAVFNAAVDSQLANAALGSEALAGYTAAGIPSVTISNIASASPGLLESLSAKFGSSAGSILKSVVGGGGDMSSWLGPLVSLAGGAMGAKAAGDASDAQLQAAREAMALQEPFRQGGLNALKRQLELLGIGGDPNAAGYGSASKKFGMSDFQADPGYGFRQSEGEKAIQRAASAAGGLGSGKFLKDAMRFNQGLASDEYGKAYDRYGTDIARQLNPLQSIAGQGLTASNTIGDLTTQAGNAQAAGKVGKANAWNNAIGQGYSMYANQQQQGFNNNMLRQVLGG